MLWSSKSITTDFNAKFLDFYPDNLYPFKTICYLFNSYVSDMDIKIYNDKDFDQRYSEYFFYDDSPSLKTRDDLKLSVSDSIEKCFHPDIQPELLRLSESLSKLSMDFEDNINTFFDNNDLKLDLNTFRKSYPSVFEKLLNELKEIWVCLCVRRRIKVIKFSFRDLTKDEINRFLHIIGSNNYKSLDNVSQPIFRAFINGFIKFCLNNQLITINADELLSSFKENCQRVMCDFSDDEDNDIPTNQKIESNSI